MNKLESIGFGTILIGVVTFLGIIFKYVSEVII